MDWAIPGFGKRRYTMVRRQPSLGVRAADLLAEWSERRQQRMMLSRMDDYSLSDIGVSRADAIEEAYKPFWRS